MRRTRRWKSGIRIFVFRKPAPSACSSEPKQARSTKANWVIRPRRSFPTTRSARMHFDGVVIPGGYAPDNIRRRPKALEFVREMDEQDKLVASICHGPWVLCSAEILKGRRATCFFAIKDDVIHAGAHYEDAEVIVDQNLVTSRKPEDLPAFCRAAIRVLIETPVLAA